MLTMLRLASLSATKKYPEIEEFAWHRFTGKRPVALDNKTHTGSIEEKDVFGLYPLTKNRYAVKHREDTDVTFEVDAATVRSLLGRSVPFKGTVNGVRVTPGKVAGTRGSSGRPETAQNATQAPYEVADRGKADKDILGALKSMKLPGAAGIRFLMKFDMLTGDSCQYFDVSSVYKEIGDDTDAWEKTIEDAVMAVTPDKYSVGATHMKYKNKPMPVLMLVE